MRSNAAKDSASYFLGVRLTPEEVRRLDEFQRSAGAATRSDAVRALVRAAGGVASEKLGELPVSLRTELEEIVEDGWADSDGGALTLAVHLGLQALAALHGREVPTLRQAARNAAQRKASRRRADREGRGLLER